MSVHVLRDIRHHARSAASIDAGSGDEAALHAARTHHIKRMGELANELDAPFKEKHAHIPWEMITRLKNILVDEFESVIHSDAWESFREIVPELIADLSDIIEYVEAEL